MINTDKKPLEKKEIKVPNPSFVDTKDKVSIDKHEELRLICNKCNGEWVEKRPFGYYVRYEKGNNFLINRHSPYDKKLFECPRCKNQTNIGRLPVLTKIIKT